MYTLGVDKDTVTDLQWCLVGALLFGTLMGRCHWLTAMDCDILTNGQFNILHSCTESYLCLNLSRAGTKGWTSIQDLHSPSWAAETLTDWERTWLVQHKKRAVKSSTFTTSICETSPSKFFFVTATSQRNVLFEILLVLHCRKCWVIADVAESAVACGICYAAAVGVTMIA